MIKMLSSLRMLFVLILGALVFLVCPTKVLCFLLAGHISFKEKNIFSPASSLKTRGTEKLALTK